MKTLPNIALLASLLSALSLPATVTGQVILGDDVVAYGTNTNTQNNTPSSGETTRTSNSYTVSANANLLLFGFGLDSTNETKIADSATWSVGAVDQSMTLLTTLDGGDGSGAGMAIFYVVNPTVGSGSFELLTDGPTGNSGERWGYAAADFENAAGAPTLFGTSTGTASNPGGLGLSTSGTVSGSNSLLVGFSGINSNTTFSGSVLEGQAGNGADGGFGYAFGTLEAPAGSTTYDVSVASNADGQAWGQIVVEVAAIPEPSVSMLLIAAGASGLLLRRRRRSATA